MVEYLMLVVVFNLGFWLLFFVFKLKNSSFLSLSLLFWNRQKGRQAGSSNSNIDHYMQSDFFFFRFLHKICVYKTLKDCIHILLYSTHLHYTYMCIIYIESNQIWSCAHNPMQCDAMDHSVWSYTYTCVHRVSKI